MVQTVTANSGRSSRHDALAHVARTSNKRMAYHVAWASYCGVGLSCMHVAYISIKRRQKSCSSCSAKTLFIFRVSMCVCGVCALCSPMFVAKKIRSSVYTTGSNNWYQSWLSGGDTTYQKWVMMLRRALAPAVLGRARSCGRCSPVPTTLSG
jgi:hypothetical protein